MSDDVLKSAWENVREGNELTPEQTRAIRDDEKAKAVKAGVVFV